MAFDVIRRSPDWFVVGVLPEGRPAFSHDGIPGGVLVRDRVTIAVAAIECSAVQRFLDFFRSVIERKFPSLPLVRNLGSAVGTAENALAVPDAAGRHDGPSLAVVSPMMSHSG